MLDATCVCTSSSSSNCNAVAASLVNLLPTVNGLFSANMSTSDVSTSMTAAFGSVAHNDCSNQALVLDVSPALGSSTPNRTAWAQAALMWSMVLSQNSLEDDETSPPFLKLGSTTTGPTLVCRHVDCSIPTP